MTTVLETTLPADPEAVAVARHALDRLSNDVSEDLLASLRLAVSELVTNGVRHGAQCEVQSGGFVELHVRLNPDRVRVEVYDCGVGFDPVEAAATEFDFESSGGRGLFIVEQLATSWGVDSNGKTCVWAEFQKTPVLQSSF
jgi:anti-sigma regulatory factor (Ser/Thr protein kinase)